MSDVSVFYAELNRAALALHHATAGRYVEETGATAGDTGIENPAHRPDLRLEMYARIDALHDSAADARKSATALSKSLATIASDFSRLDEVLSGEGHR